MKETAAARVRYDYRRIRILLNPEGWQVGKNLGYRLHCDEGLTLPWQSPKRRMMAVQREKRHVPQHANDVWSLDFVADELHHGQRFRGLNGRRCLCA